ncbi:MAG: hypothetical protein E7212_07450 [Clostridium sartagoforme]|nr:hypothetical protein [Clostridium sartagoforme]
MEIRNKSIDSSKNKCVACSKEIYIDDIIIKRSLFCHKCNNIISELNINDIEYDFYKERIKRWLVGKYNLIA